MVWNLVTEGELGTRHNLKTDPALATLKALRRLDPNTVAYCRDSKGTGDPNIRNIWPFGKHIPRLTLFAYRYLGLPFPYLDHMASQKLNRDCQLLYALPTWPFTETLRKAKSMGILTVGHDAGINPSWYKRGVMQETQQPAKAAHLDYLVTLSKYAQRSYVQMGFPEDRVFCAPLGVDTLKYQPKDKQDDVFRVVAVGDDYKRKGFDLLLDAWRQLKLPNAELILIGNIRKDKARIKHLAAKMTKVHMLSHRDPTPYYQKANLLVHPARRESFGKIVTEAMASGLPVVISDQTGAKDLITEGQEGYVVPAQDTDAIKKRIRELYHDPDKRLRMGQAARKLVEENYTWEHFSERIYKILVEICKREGIAPPKEEGT